MNDMEIIRKILEGKLVIKCIGGIVAASEDIRIRCVKEAVKKAVENKCL